jgi:hypothetical protein
VRLLGELAHTAAVLAARALRRVLGLCSVPAGGGLLALGLGALGLLAQLLGGALDRALGELAIQRPVDDDRRGLSELDQDARGPCLVDVQFAEADRRRAVGVLVDLAVELLCLGELLGRLLARRSSSTAPEGSWCR